MGSSPIRKGEARMRCWVVALMSAGGRAAEATFRRGPLLGPGPSLAPGTLKLPHIFHMQNGESARGGSS